MREAVSTFISNHIHEADAKPLYSGFFPPFFRQWRKIYTHNVEDKHMLTHTHHSLCKVLHIVYQVLNFKRKYWLKSSTYYFIKHARSLHGCGCGYLQMTHHCWPESPGMQGWTMQGGAGGPSLHKEAFHISHSHPQNASSKAPAFCQVKSNTSFSESSICF